MSIKSRRGITSACVILVQLGTNKGLPDSPWKALSLWYARGDSNAKPLDPQSDALFSENDILRPFPHHQVSQIAQLLAAFDNSKEVVAGQLAHLAGEHGGAIGEKDFR